jgi:hypothetical protein
MTETRDEPSGVTRWPFALLAYLFVGLALLGVALPGLPTFPFLLLAAWAASRGSRKLHDWLYEHPSFGPSLARWRDQRAISGRAKATAIALLVLSWIILWWRTGDARVLVPLALLFVAVSIFLLSRPTPRPVDPPDTHDGHDGEDGREV